MLTQSQNNEVFLTPSKFELIIDKMVFESDYNYMQAIVEYCEEQLIDYEDIKKYLNSNLKKKIQADAITYNYFGKRATLPFEEE